MENPNESIVKINVRKHYVTIEDELHVHIRHTKECKSPCTEIEPIIDYLERELFLAEGFVVTNSEDE